MVCSRPFVVGPCAKAVLALGAVTLFLAAPAARVQGAPTTRPAALGAGTKPAAAATKPSSPATKPGATTKLAATAPGAVPKPLTLAPLAKPLPGTPSTVADLTAIERRVEQLTERVLPAVVGVSVHGGQGSGVIVSPDGYVLTAGHVSGDPNVEVGLTLADGRRVAAKTLGHDEKMDAGLIKITEPGTWPYCEIGKSADLKVGQWVAALGHPGGYRKDRPPVLRLGKVLDSRGPDRFIATDCTLVGGDSGGPLFDLNGKVVGIHSRIGPSTQNNMHVPADTFARSWDRLAKGEEWDDSANPLSGLFKGRGRAAGPMLGIIGETVDDDGAGGGRGARVKSLIDKTPAVDVGIQPGDVIVSFDRKPVRTVEDLSGMIAARKVGDRVVVALMRDGKRIEKSATLVLRPRE